MMRTFFVLISLFFAMEAQAQITMLRLDMAPRGSFTFWVEHEMKSGFTPEILHSTDGWSELDLGWTFHPMNWLIVKTYLGGLTDGSSFNQVSPILLAFVNYEQWGAESWAQGFVDVGDLPVSVFFFREILTYYGFGPWVEGVVGKGFHEIKAGGVISQELNGGLIFQLRLGSIIEAKQFTWGASLMYFF